MDLRGSFVKLVIIAALSSHISTCIASGSTNSAPARKAADKKKVVSAPRTDAAAPKKVVKPWEPIAFDNTVDRLPPNYTGLDAVNFFEMLKSKLDGLKKGEFETTEEFKLRTADVENLIKPINTSDLYAFKPMQYILKKYNPDTQSYLIDLLCKDTYSSSKHKNLVTCFTVAAKIDNSTYTGTNAYGAEVNIERSRGTTYSLAISKDSAIFKEFIRKDEHIYYFHKFYGKLNVPIEKARILKEPSYTLSVLFIGNLVNHEIIEGRPNINQPTISAPRDTLITEEAVHLNIKNIIYYIVETGEILEKIEVQ